MKAAFARPGVREKQIEGLTRPEVRARLSEASQARWDDPAQADAMLKAIAEGLAKPGVREKTIEAIRKAAADPTKGQTRSASLKKFYADHPEALEELIAQGQRNRDNPVLLERMLEALKKNAADPEVQKLMIEGRKRWWAEHPEECEQRSKDIAAGWAKRNAETERLKNLEGLEVKTGLRISLAACLSLEGANPYVMRNDVSPGARDPLDSTKKLFTNYANKIEAEKARLAKLSEDQRRSEGEQLRLSLHRLLGADTP